MFDYDILLCNPPILKEEPDYAKVGSLAKLKMKAINPGLLSIGSYLENKNFIVKIIDLSENSDIDALKTAVQSAKPRVFGISSESGYSYLETMECSDIVKEESPETLCVAGGFHIGFLRRTALDECKSLDIIVTGEGEWITEQIIRSCAQKSRLKRLPGIALRVNGEVRESTGRTPEVDLNELPFINFELYPNYKDFIPFVEESRGCPSACNYCPNTAMYAKYRIKKHDRFAAELDNTIGFFGKDVIYATLASDFGIDVRNTLNISEELGKRGIEWIAQTRPDTPSNAHIETLWNSGLRVLSLGMESADPENLVRMGKTSNPIEWIKRTEDIVEKASKMEQFKLRTNIMLYVGETPRSVKRTLGFLIAHSKGIAMAPAMTVFAVPGSCLMENFPRFEKEFGCKLLQTVYSMRTHLFPCHLSKYFDYEEAAYLCNTIEKLFAAEESYDAMQTGDYKKFQEILPKRITHAEEDERL